ncbi:hypothetical protein LAZ67_6002636 [Cordylochernes scorpioides]|uniref:Uncharacterized protein n=1 Tax=Cordylochernes scorpioides TaxID=51811 RepID=A0ABY6KNL8_9ARAC|nr:hypothetical protein LAZ67_6002636 [Cordylochernes scorpioides]
MKRRKSIKILHKYGTFAAPLTKNSLKEILHAIEDITLATRTNSKYSFDSYIERLDYFFKANYILKEEKKKSDLSDCGTSTFDLIKSIVAPNDIGKLKYEEIVQAKFNHREIQFS